MAGFNRYTRFYAATKTGSPTSTCVFISHRLSDLNVAKAVGRYLNETVNVGIYLSDSDEDLQEAVKNKDDQRIVRYIEAGISVSTHLLGIISNRTKGSWWVPFEFGAGRQRSMSIAQLLLEEVIEAPSYLRIATILSDSLDLRNWAKEIDSRAAKAASSLPIPDLPRVTRIKVQPKWVGRSPSDVRNDARARAGHRAFWISPRGCA